MRSTRYSTSAASRSLRLRLEFHQFQRLKDLLNCAKQKGQVLAGGELDDQEKRITPTLIEIKDRNDPLMEEELFGPLMPILNISTLDAAVQGINQQPRPLAIYMFGGTEKEKKILLNQTS